MDGATRPDRGTIVEMDTGPGDCPGPAIDYSLPPGFSVIFRITSSRLKLAGF